MKAAILAMLLPLLPSAVLAEDTSTPTPASVTSNAAPSGVTSNAASSSVTIDGATYEEVRWGRLTPSTVTIFHKTGVATVPLEKLPPELQRKFAYDPQKAIAYRAAAAERAAYERDFKMKVVVDGKLVSTNQVQFTQLSGVLRETNVQVQDSEGGVHRGVVVEVGVYQTHTYTESDPLRSIGGGGGAVLRGWTEKVGSYLAFVKDAFVTNAIGTGVFFNVVEVNRIANYRVFATGARPTFEEWKGLKK